MVADTTDSPGSPPAWKWTGAQTLYFVYALNERSLQVLCRRVIEEGRIFPECETFEKITACQKLRFELDESARHRAAKCPFLLIDMRFQDERWWREVGDGATSPDGKNLDFSIFPAEPAREWSAETLTLAWHAARSDLRAASLILGSSARVAAIIAALSPRQIQSFVAREAHNLCPRWENNSVFWRELLLSAIGGKEKILTKCRLESLQLLGNDLLSTG